MAHVGDKVKMKKHHSEVRAGDTVRVQSVHPGFYGVYSSGGVAFVPTSSVDSDHDGDNDTPGSGGDTDHDAGVAASWERMMQVVTDRHA